MAHKRTYGTRTLLELSVGNNSGRQLPLSVEIIVHLRSADLKWWNDDLFDHENQLLKIIGRRILPLECRDEVEGTGSRIKSRRGGIRGSCVVIGEKNLKRSVASSGGVSDRRHTGNGKRSKNASDKPKGEQAVARNKEKKKSKGGKGEGNANKAGQNCDKSYLFGETIQITYRVEELPVSNTATLIYDGSQTEDEVQDKDRGAEEEGGEISGGVLRKEDSVTTFRRLEKIPKQIVVWCYQFDPKNPTEPIPDDGGFPRPELVPISLLFA